MLRTNTVFCCHRNEMIARLKEDFGYETRLPLTLPYRPYWGNWITMKVGIYAPSGDGKAKAIYCC